MTSMTEHVNRYVALQRHLGHKYAYIERVLRDYAQWLEDQGGIWLKAEQMIIWASKSSKTEHSREKLAILRLFAKWLHAEDERHEIPARDALGRIARRRPPPCLMTVDEIKRLLSAAREVGQAGTINPHTYHYLFGLMASTGIRRCEAIALELSDVTSDGLVIRESKFLKSRLVPIHTTVRAAIAKYIKLRERVPTSSNHLFVLFTGRPPSACSATGTFRNLARKVGLREQSGRKGPRLHDLRHCFAVRSLEATSGQDPESASRHILALSTYLGHQGPAQTYWYLEATPLVLNGVAEATEKLHAGSCHQ